MNTAWYQEKTAQKRTKIQLFLHKISCIYSPLPFFIWLYIERKRRQETFIYTAYFYKRDPPNRIDSRKKWIFWGIFLLACLLQRQLLLNNLYIILLDSRYCHGVTIDTVMVSLLGCIKMIQPQQRFAPILRQIQKSNIEKKWIPKGFSA